MGEMLKRADRIGEKAQRNPAAMKWKSRGNKIARRGLLHDAICGPGLANR